MTVDTTDSGYTHAQWKQETGDVLLITAAAVKAMELMLACLAEVKAGKTQTELVQACMARGGEILQAGLGLVDDTDRRYIPVGEAIDAAGGQTEVAHVKHYHQT